MSHHNNIEAFLLDLYMYYVYADVNLFNNQSFYYGSGNIERLTEIERNNAHSKIIKKLQKKWKRIIVFQSKNRKECYEIEKILIALNIDDKANCNKIVDSTNKDEVLGYKNLLKGWLCLNTVSQQYYFSNRSKSLVKIFIETRVADYSPMKLKKLYKFKDVEIVRDMYRIDKFPLNTIVLL